MPETHIEVHPGDGAAAATAIEAARSAGVAQEHTKSQIELIWAELRWHKYLLLAVVAGIFGQYMGLGAAVSSAMPFK